MSKRKSAKYKLDRRMGEGLQRFDDLLRPDKNAGLGIVGARNRLPNE